MKAKINNMILTKDAFRKINDYSYIVSSIVGKPIEVMGLLIGDKDDPLSIGKDAYLIQNQSVTASESFPDDRSLGDAYYETIAGGNNVVGMWHSHGDYPNFHSTYDNDYLENLVTFNSFMYPNHRTIEGEKVPFAASIVINQNSYLRQNPFKDLRRTKHYYCRAGYRENGDIRLTESLELILIPSISRIQRDYLALFCEVCDQVSFQGKRLGSIFEESAHQEKQKSIYAAVTEIFGKLFA